jgi:hypothetical protein
MSAFFPSWAIMAIVMRVVFAKGTKPGQEERTFGPIPLFPHELTSSFLVVLMIIRYCFSFINKTNIFMRTLFLTALSLVFAASMAMAQIETPRPSPMCKMEQKVGLTDVTLEFYRPSVKGRELFVDVESFGQIWRTGANASSKISFSGDVMIEGNKVPAGTYAIYSIPGKETWTIMLYKDLTLGGYVGNYDKEQELLRFDVKAQMAANSVETFFIMIDNITYNSAEISLQWGKYRVPFSLEVMTDDQVMKDIEQTLAGPTAGDYYAAASYYYETGKDMSKALEWVQKANAENARYWTLRMEANILHKLGKNTEAKDVLKKSAAMARDAGNEGYAKQNEMMMAEW